MISFVCWKWAAPGSGREFLSEHVNVLRSMLARYCHIPHRLICITDETAGLDGRVDVLPPPSRVLDGLANPEDGKTRKARRADPLRRSLNPLPPKPRPLFPACYRRLWNFSRDAVVLGPRIVAIDIDVVICADVTPLFGRMADFVGWCDVRFGWRKIAGGMYSLKTGSHPEVWDDFIGQASIDEARAAGNGGSDQAWISYKLFPLAQSWSSVDGIVKLKWLGTGTPAAPPAIRMAFTSGNAPPWHPKTLRQYPWIRDHWKISR